MSTTPVSPTNSSTVPPTGTGPETRNYHRPGLPVLSFSYALYCDTAFSQAHYDIWVAAKRAGHDYRGYLEPYRWDQTRRFPLAAMELIAADVPDHGKVDPNKSRYIPTFDQAWEMMAFLVAEITGAPELPMASGESRPDPAPWAPGPIIPATINNERPLLSCLAVIFLNGDSDFRLSPERFLANFGISEQARGTLLTFGAGGQRYLSPGQGLALLPDLVAEFVKPPACW